MKNKPPTIKESQVQKTVMSYLQILENQRKVWCFRAGSGAIKTEQGNYFRTGKIGCPDIVCCFPPSGRFVGLEIKSSVGGQQSPAQKEAEGRIKTLGGRYFVVRSLEEIVKIIKNDLRANF